MTVLESDSASALLSETHSDRELASFPVGLALTLTLALGVFVSLAPGIGFEGVRGAKGVSSWSVARWRMVMVDVGWYDSVVVVPPRGVRLGIAEGRLSDEAGAGSPRGLFV